MANIPVDPLQLLRQRLDELELSGIGPDALVPVREAMELSVRKYDTLSRELEDGRNSSRRLRTMAETLNDWVWEVDACGNYTYVSDMVRNFLGYEPEEMIGRSPFEFMIPEEVERVGGIFAGYLEGRQSFRNLENINRHKDSRLVTLETSGIPFYESDGKFAGYLGADRDITERKKIEDDLRRTLLANEELSRRMMLAVDAAGIGIWELDLTNNFLVWDKWMYRIYGIDQNSFSMTYEAWWNGLHPDDRERAVAKSEAAFAGEKAIDTDFRVIHPSGEIRHIKNNAVVTRDENGRPVRITGINYDITGRTLAEQTIVSQKEQLEGIIEGTRAGTWQWNVQTGEVVFNERWGEIVGYSLEELMPHTIDTWGKLIHPDDLEESMRLIERYFSGELPYYEFTCRMRRKDGSWVWILDRGKVIKWCKDGKPLLMSGTHQEITEQKELEQELARKVNQLDALYNGISDAIFIADVETRKIMACNHVAEKMMEADSAVLQERTIESLHPVDVLDDNMQAFQRLAAGLQRVVESELLSASGRRIPVSVLASKVEYKGRPCLMGVFRDITESKDFEARLMASNQQLQASEQQLMASNQQLLAGQQQLLASNRQLQITEQRLKAKQLLQELLTEISILLMKPNAAHPDETIEQALGMIGSLEGADRCYIFQFSDGLRTVSNTHEWCREGIQAQKDTLQDLPSDIMPWWMQHLRRMEPVFVPKLADLPLEASAEKELLEMQGIQSLLVLPIADGNVLRGFLGLDWVTQPVSSIQENQIPLLQLGGDLIFSALNRAVASMRILERETKYRLIFESIQDLYVEIDVASGAVFEVSPSIRQLGYTREEVLHAPVMKFYKYPEELEQLFRELRVRHSLQDYEVHILRKDGSVATMSLSISLQQDRPDHPLKVVSTMRDISLRKEHELQIRESMRLKNDFIASVSHELRTPLFSILGFSSTLLKQDAVLDCKTRNEFVSIIHDESVRLSSLIEDLLSISRIESGKMNYKLHRFNPVGVVSAVVDVLRKQAFDKQIELVEEYPARALFIDFDQDSLKQVMMNLLGNALKFTLGGGKVFTRVCVEGETIRIEVEDTGIGIATDEIEKIFEKFYRSEHHGINVDGTGLGLAIVKEIVETQGGKVEGRSKINKGSVFSVLLSLAAEDPPGDA